MYSKECQAANWKEHKATCKRISKDCKEWNENMTRELPDSKMDDTKEDEGPCAICLEEKIINPVSLPCGHVFCFECVGQFQLASKKKEALVLKKRTLMEGASLRHLSPSIQKKMNPYVLIAEVRFQMF